MRRPIRFSVRAAEECEARACRMLLPQAFPIDPAPELLVALGPDSTLIGAAAVGWVAAGDASAFPIAVEVVPPWRRRGVGHALIDAAAASVRGETTGLQPWNALEDDSEAVGFFLACGFYVHHRVLHFIGDATSVEALLARHRTWLTERGRIPANARLVGLRDAPHPELAHLLAREFHNSPAQVLARLHGESAPPFDAERSVVLLVDGAVMGAQIWTNGDDGVPQVEVNVVSPTLRHGWANVLLTHEGVRIGVTKGTHAFRFFCHERVIDTVNIARRSGAKLARTDVVLRRDIAAA